MWERNSPSQYASKDTYLCAGFDVGEVGLRKEICVSQRRACVYFATIDWVLPRRDGSLPFHGLGVEWLILITRIQVQQVIRLFLESFGSCWLAELQSHQQRAKTGFCPFCHSIRIERKFFFMKTMKSFSLFRNEDFRLIGFQIDFELTIDDFQFDSRECFAPSTILRPITDAIPWLVDDGEVKDDDNNNQVLAFIRPTTIGDDLFGEISDGRNQCCSISSPEKICAARSVDDIDAEGKIARPSSEQTNPTYWSSSYDPHFLEDSNRISTDLTRSFT